MHDPPTAPRPIAPRARLVRVIGSPGGQGRLSPLRKTLLFFLALFVLSALLAWLDPRPTLRHVKLTVLSGAPSGNYHAIVERLAAETARRRGSIRNQSSAGSVENVQRLIAARHSCEVQFALVQGGTVVPDDAGLELLGRLPQPESLIILGRNVDRLRTPADLVGMRIGIGPVGSGTEQMMRRLLAQVPELRLQVSTQSIDQQLDMVARGELELAAMVIDEGAALVHDAVVRRHLQMLDLPDASALARRLPFVRPGRIEAGQIDYMRRLPPRDLQLLQMDTLIVGNGCAKNGATVGLLTAVAEVFPTFIQHNRGQPNLSGLPMATVATDFLQDEGPDVLGTYAPWAMDILPLPTWIQLGVALSVLFSAMAIGHRFRLWRIDGQRVKIEREVAGLFHGGVTLGEIADLPPDARHGSAEARARLDSLIGRLEALAERCRRQSLSILVPMGAEMFYRYQESLIAELLYALRVYRERLPPAT
ncbi:MAG: TAXI family TRAP transporter solute-binding subunit [Burkholderiaceae bacterium]